MMMMRSRAFPRALLVVLAMSLLATAPAQAAPADLDASFGIGGMQTTDFGGDEKAYGSAVSQPDGKVVVVGRTFPGDYSIHFAIARYNADGTLLACRRPAVAVIADESDKSGAGIAVHPTTAPFHAKQLRFRAGGNRRPLPLSDKTGHVHLAEVVADGQTDGDGSAGRYPSTPIRVTPTRLPPSAQTRQRRCGREPPASSERQ